MKEIAMNKISITSILVTGLVIFSGVSLADSGHHGKGRFLALFDTNGDGVVTTDEFKAAAAERFKTMDSDSSGGVTQEEFDNYLAEKREKWNTVRFQNIDTDGDGNISEAEYLESKKQRAQKRFQQMDKDGNGIISQNEFMESRHTGKKYGMHGKGKIFAKLDRDSNGEITESESLAAWTEWFTKIDLNGDKVVTSDEVREFRMNNLNTKD